MEQVVALKKGDILALYPNELHKTGVKVTETVSVKKVVFKIEL
jgi:YhcH/YjgK/YiaL family protein